MFQVLLVTAKNITKTRVLFELRIGTAGLQYKYRYITISHPNLSNQDQILNIISLQ